MHLETEHEWNFQTPCIQSYTIVNEKHYSLPGLYFQYNF